MKKKAQQKKQYERANGIRSAKLFHLRAAVKDAFHTLVKEGGCPQQELIEVLILHAVAASPREKAEMFRAAHEAARASAVARVERKYGKAPEASVTAA